MYKFECIYCAYKTNLKEILKDTALSQKHQKNITSNNLKRK